MTEGTEVVAVPGGDVMLTKVTGTGCALGAAMAAFLAAPTHRSRRLSPRRPCSPPRRSARPREVRGPGGMAVALLDHLYLIGVPE